MHLTCYNKCVVLTTPFNRFEYLYLATNEAVYNRVFLAKLNKMFFGDVQLYIILGAEPAHILGIRKEYIFTTSKNTFFRYSGLEHLDWSLK